MTVRTNVTGATEYVLQEALSGYTDEAYTNAKKLSGTGIIGSDQRIDPSTETFVGQMRWNKPFTPEINIASLTNSANGNTTSYTTDYLKYVKTVRTHGAEKINVKEVVTQVDGLAKIARDFGETRAQDEHNAILAVLRGVAASEALNGAASGSGEVGLGGQSFDNDPVDDKYGFYVDNGANKLIVDATTAIQGAQRAQSLLDAFGKAFKDYEPEYCYCVTSPEVMASFRAANLVDQDRIRDGSMDFQTLFQGKFRLIQTRATQSFNATELDRLNDGSGVDIAGTKTTFLVLPGAIAMTPLMVPEPVEIDRSAAAYQGGGTTQIWYRWGYVAHPAGYDWAGSENEFASDTTYQSVIESSTVKALSAVTDTTGADNSVGIWTRKASSALSLGILPVFHA